MREASLAIALVMCGRIVLHWQIGDGTTVEKLSPAASVLSGVASVAAGYHHTCVVMAVSRGVRCWGRNAKGQV
jgi:hypothetical protein